MSASSSQTGGNLPDKSKMTSEELLDYLTGLSNEEKIQELASLFFTIGEIALFIDMDEESLRSKIKYEKQSKESIAYRKGVMSTNIKLRFDTRRFAIAGNPQAEEEMKQYYTRQKLAENA